MEKVSGSSAKLVHGIVDVAPKQLATRVTEADKHLDALDALFIDAKVLQSGERRKMAKLRGPEEAAVLSGVLEFAAEHEQLFLVLADEDEGDDPARFETDLVSIRLANAQTLAALAVRAAAFHQKVADAALLAASLAKPVALKAYAIAKQVAHTATEANLIAPAVKFYAKASDAAAKTKAQNKANAAAQAGASPVTAAGSNTTK